MKDFKFYIFLASVLLVIYIVAQLNRPALVNWERTLADKDKIPYGTYILYHQLHDLFPHSAIKPFHEPAYNAITDYNIKNANYLIVCNDLDLDEADYNKLTEFVKKGNDVMIASSSFGDQFSKKLKVETGNELMYKRSSNAIRFVNAKLDTTHFYAIDKPINNGYFSSFDITKATILGDNSFHHINFVKFKMGNGTLYLNANPLMFSNYSLLSDQGPEYISTALSYLKNKRDLIWDEYYTSGMDDNDSPMRVFLRNGSLRYAYYIALASMLLFVLYEIKRRQRIIPVIEPLNNSTLDFVNVVGQVYYEQRNNSNIAQKKAAYFLEYLRTKYSLKTSVLDQEFETVLAHKSGADTILIHDIIKQVILVHGGGVAVSDGELIDLNKNIEQFYFQSR